MESRHLLFVLILSVAFLTGCKIKPQRSQLEIRQMQTRKFRTTDKKKVMSAVTDALMDMGYVINDTNMDLGIVNAEKERTRREFMGKSQNMFKLTAKVSPMKQVTRVRVNIQKTTVSQSRYDDDDDHHPDKYSSPVRDPKVYRNIFNKIDKSLFIEEEVHNK